MQVHHQFGTRQARDDALGGYTIAPRVLALRCFGVTLVCRSFQSTYGTENNTYGVPSVKEASTFLQVRGCV